MLKIIKLYGFKGSLLRITSVMGKTVKFYEKSLSHRKIFFFADIIGFMNYHLMALKITLTFQI